MTSKIFENRTVLVTGGSSGIGLAIATRVALSGGNVMLMARDAERLLAAKDSLPNKDRHCAYACDLADEDAVVAAFREIKERISPLYAAVLAAGAHAVRPLAITKAKDLEAMYAANVLTALNVSRACMKFLDPEGASLLFLSSAAALHGSSAAVAYAAAKGALLSAMRSLAKELAGRKVRANAIAAGVVKTSMSEKFLGTLLPEHQQQVEKDHPLGLGTPDQVAAAASFLISADANWITGATLAVDGGLTCS